MFRCFIGPGKMSATDLESRISDWVQSNAEWENDTVPHTLKERGAYYQIDVRFLPDNSKANLQQKFTDKLVNKVSWYRIGYHACTHDADQTVIESVNGEEWTAVRGNPVDVDNGRLVKQSVRVFDDGEQVSSSAYEMDYNKGQISALSNGELTDGTNYTTDYEYYEAGGYCHWDDSVEWTAKDVSIPAGVPVFEAE